MIVHALAPKVGTKNTFGSLPGLLLLLYVWLGEACLGRMCMP